MGLPWPVSLGSRILTRYDFRAALMLPEASAFEERVRRHAFHLLAEPASVDIHHCVVGLVRRAAQGVRHEDDAEAPVNSAHHGCEHADVGFAAGDNDSVRSCASQQLVQIAPGPGGIDMLVEEAGGRANRASSGTTSIMSAPSSSMVIDAQRA
jgi:hypothetical protein